MGLIIGTAGHVDHGKTELIKVLTGIDTDRLPEEKKRGMTIVLGFAFIDLPKSGRVGIVDVPGHERYLKNMLSGVWGIDLALLVIAADEGIMPQTKEHFEILQFAEVKKIVVALTKTDIVDDEIIESAIMEITDMLQNTIYADSNIIKVSSKTGASGISDLKQALDKALCTLQQKKPTGIPIFPIDRIFMLKGVGSVATGSLINGTLRIGDKVYIYPYNIVSKVKQIQAHNELKNEISAGNRVGLNLANVKVDEISTGAILSSEFLPTSRLITVKLNLKKDITIKNRMRIRLHIMTDEILGRIFLQKESEYCQILLEKEVPVWFKSKFIIRNYSPQYLIGSGIVLNPLPVKPEKKDRREVTLLKNREINNMEKIIIEESSKENKLKLSDLRKTLFTLHNEFDTALNNLLVSGKVKLLSHYIMNSLSLETIKQWTVNELNNFYKSEPLVKHGIQKEELRKRLNNSLNIKIDSELFESIIQQITEIDVAKDKILLKNWKTLLSDEQIIELKKIEELIRSKFCSFKDFDREIINILHDERKIVNIKNEFFVHKDNFEQWKLTIKQHIEKNNEISVSDIKNILGATRRHTIPFAEYLDEIRFTKRIGDKRILY